MSASQRAQKAYEDALSRQIQSSQTMGQLGQAGAGTSLQATQTGMQGAQQAGAMGLSGLAQAGQQGQAATGQAMQGAQMGMQGAQQAGAMGMQGAQQAGQMGMQGAQQAGSAAAQAGGLSAQGAQLGMQGAQMGNAGGKPSIQYWTRHRATWNTVRATWYAGRWTDGHDCWSIRCNGSRLGWFRNEPSAVGRSTTRSTVKRSKHFNADRWSGTGTVPSTIGCGSSEPVPECYATISTTWLLLRYLSGYAVIAINLYTDQCTRAKHSLSTWWPSSRWIWNVQRNAIRN